ncbi:hypothetical protein CDD83_241 [Cordyceps sp. RAO-2017]|nr:hypothetical protein CDD83_241 [Cordyceps sp. RAO-2017]
MALSLASAVATSYGALNGYWGQSSGPDLRTYCDSGIKYATLAFVNMAPENDRSKAGYPGINFSSHCWAETFLSEDGGESQLLSHCQSLKKDIPYCQSKGVKVILSIGGEYRQPSDPEDLSSDYLVTTDQNGEHFAEFLYKAFGPYSSGWTGPRPFDDSDNHVAVDGFDFDIEATFDNGPYVAMINKLRALDRNILITGAPQCPTNPQYFQMKDMIQKAAFDALFIQFYNNPSCDAIPDNDVGDRFNLDEWVDVVAASDKSKDAKLFVGLPASPDAAGSGYISPREVKDLVCKHKDTKNFGGVSLWDLKNGADNVSGGKTFYQHVLDALRYGCEPVPTAVPTSAGQTTTRPASSTSTSSASQSIASSSTAVVSNTTTTTTTTSRASQSIVSSSTAVVSNTTTTTTSSEVQSTISSSTAVVSNTTAPATSSDVQSTISSSAVVSSNSTTTTAAVSTTASTTSSSVGSSRMWSNSTMTSATSVAMTTSTVYTTQVRTVTACPPEVTNCPLSSHIVVTETIPLYTTVCPVTATATAVPPKPPVSATTSEAMTTSTVYTTQVRTVTACPPEVTNCPLSSHIVVTETIPLYTTVCPVTQTALPPRPTVHSESTQPMTTSTVYTTRIRSVTSCPPYVAGCQHGKVITETIPLYTTVCPVTQTAHVSRPIASHSSPLAKSSVVSHSQPAFTESSLLPTVSSASHSPPASTQTPPAVKVSSASRSQSTASQSSPAVEISTSIQSQSTASQSSPAVEISTSTQSQSTASQTTPPVVEVTSASPSQPTPEQTTVVVTTSTSTVYTTRFHTVATCLPGGAADCHPGQVKTQTVALSTAVYTVTQTVVLPKPLRTETSLPATVSTEPSPSRAASTTHIAGPSAPASCRPGIDGCPVPSPKVVTQSFTKVVSWAKTDVVEQSETAIPTFLPPVYLAPSAAGPPASSSVAPAYTVTHPVGEAAGSSTTARLPGATPEAPKPGQVDVECSGPGCAGVPGAPAPGCAGRNCTSQATAPSSSSQSSTSFQPSAVPEVRVVAGASSLAASLAGLVAVFAIQLFVL